MAKLEMFLNGTPFKIAGNVLHVHINHMETKHYVVIADTEDSYFCNADFIDNNYGLIVSFYKSWLGNIVRRNFVLDQIEFLTPQS